MKMQIFWQNVIDRSRFHSQSLLGKAIKPEKGTYIDQNGWYVKIPD